MPLKYYVSTNINGSSSVLCNNATRTFTAINIPGASYSWSVGNGLTLNSNGNYSTSVTSNSSYNGSSWFEVTITSPLGGSSNDVKTSKKKTFWVGKPNKPTNIYFYPYEPCLNQWVIATVQANNPAISGVHYDWRGTHTYIEQNPSGSEVHFTTLQRFPYTTYVYVKGTNTCGSSLEYSELLSVKDCGGGLPPAPAVVVSPNPSSSEITVNIGNEISTDLLMNSESNFKIANYDISVFNIYGIPVFKGKIYGKSTKLNVSNWAKGLYLIKISDGKQAIEGTFLVE